MRLLDDLLPSLPSVTKARSPQKTPYTLVGRFSLHTPHEAQAPRLEPVGLEAFLMMSGAYHCAEAQQGALCQTECEDL